MSLSTSSEELELLLDSRPLMGYQLDASHLHEILKALIRQGTARDAALNRRLATIENAVSDLDRRCGRLEAQAGDQEALRALQQDLRTVAGAVDALTRQSIPELRRGVEENRARSLANERAIAALNSSSLAQSLRQLEGIVSAQGQQLDQLARLALPALQRDAEELRARLAALERATSDTARDLLSRLAAFERELAALREELAGGAGAQARWRDALDELNQRMNDNFRALEQSANAVDAELGKLRSDQSNLRAELNTLDNNTRYRLGKITDDVDEKFKMLLDTLRAFETNSSEMQEALSTAGTALARSRQNRLSSLQAAASYVAPPGNGSGSQSSSQTTTTRNYLY